VSVQKRKPIMVPDDILSRHLSAEELATLQGKRHGHLQHHVFGTKDRSVDCCAPKADKRSLKDLTPANPEGIHAARCDLGSRLLLIEPPQHHAHCYPSAPHHTDRPTTHGPHTSPRPATLCE
jgi:hypothetical protein